MKQIDQLWQDRVQAYIQELRRYLKYMFNDHLLFVLVFGGGAAVYYYSQWVQTLSSDVPIEFIMAIVLAILLAISPVHTLLKEADIVYLLPLEKKLGNYFRKGIVLSFVSQSYILLIVLALFMPMYAQVTEKGFNTFFYYLLVLLVMKIWNLTIHWMTLKMTGLFVAILEWIIRYVFNVILLYLIIAESSVVWIGITIVVMLLYFIYVKVSTENKILQWEKLIAKEQNRMQIFYRAANMFTDVPHLKGQVKRRQWLDRLFSHIPYGSNQVYRYLYNRTLIRTSDYSGLVIRLTIISFLVLQLMDNLYFSLAISLLFLYLTGFQLLPMIRRFELKIWPELYPIHPMQKNVAFEQIVLKVLVMQAIIFGIGTVISSNFLQGVIVGASAVIFAILFAKFYAPGRVKKMLR